MNKYGRQPALKLAEQFEIRLMREAGVSIADCAKYFNVSEPTVYRVLSALRMKMGPEKLKRRQSARSHLIARNVQAIEPKLTLNNES